MPTGNIVSNNWFIRVTLPHQAIRALIDKNMVSFLDHSHWLVVNHVGKLTEKEHVHCLVKFSEPLQKQSVDKRYKRIFGVSGADYSSKQWDGDMGAGAGSYLFHDPSAEVMFRRGFTDEEIQEFQRLNADIQKVVEVNKQRASGRCVERVLANIIDSNREWTKEEIAGSLLDDIKEGVMYEPGDYVLKRYIEEIYTKQLKGTKWAQYRSLRIDNLLGIRPEDKQYYRPI